MTGSGCSIERDRVFCRAVEALWEHAESDRRRDETAGGIRLREKERRTGKEGQGHGYWERGVVVGDSMVEMFSK